jgi:predicted lipid-binding transport protein (Tim44 family)
LFAYIVVIVVIVGVVLGARLFLRRQAEQRAAHDARLRTMAQATLAAMKKKQAAEAAAAAAKAAPSAVTAEAVRDERECPFCAEPILRKARVCKHCGRDV